VLGEEERTEIGILVPFIDSLLYRRALFAFLVVGTYWKIQIPVGDSRKLVQGFKAELMASR